MKPALSHHSGNTKITILLLISLLGLLTASYFYIQIDAKKNNRPLLFESKQKPAKTEEIKSSSKPLPIILPAGKQTYRFSHGKDVVGPKPESITIDPLTPNKGEKQTVTLKISAAAPAESASIEIITDNKSADHRLNFADGNWTGSWEIDDTYDYKYGLRLVLKNGGTYDNTVWIR